MRIQEQRIGQIDGIVTVGFVARLKLLDIEDLLDIVDPDRLPVEGKPMTISQVGLDIKDDAILTELVMPSQQATFKEGSVSDLNGISYQLVIDATLPTRPDLLNWLRLNQGRRWLAIWIDLTGQPYVAGGPGNGLVLNYQRSLTDRNQLRLTLSGRSVHPTWYLESFNTATLFDQSDFSLDFNFDYDS